MLQNRALRSNFYRKFSTILDFASKSSLYGEPGTRNRIPIRLQLNMKESYLRKLKKSSSIRNIKVDINSFVRTHFFSKYRGMHISNGDGFSDRTN